MLTGYDSSLQVSALQGRGAELCSYLYITIQLDDMNSNFLQVTIDILDMLLLMFAVTLDKSLHLVGSH